jgi:hypothetical protein
MKIRRRSASRPSVAVRDRDPLVIRVKRASGLALSRVSRLVGGAVGTMRATRAGAASTTSALQAYPDSTLRGFAATSIGLGAGLYVAGKRRLVVAAGLVPALLAGAAIVLRRVDPAVQVEDVG